MRKDFFRCYSRDASRMKGRVDEVLHPRSVDEVCKMVINNSKICIRGAGTGLAGGCVPQGEVVMDLSKMVKISNFNEKQKTVVVEAGVVLDDLQDFLEPFGLEFPVKPSSHAIATIGGMVSTNAVGNRGVKYGKTGNWVRWIEIVDADGRIERKGVTEMSDYVGMEGITGIIVRICLNLAFVIKRSANLVRLDSVEGVVELVRRLKRRSDVCAIEFFDKTVGLGVGFSEKNKNDEFGNGYYVLVEYEHGVRFEDKEEGDLEERLEGEDYNEVMRKRDLVYPFLAGEGFVRIEDPKIFPDRLP